MSVRNHIIEDRPSAFEHTVRFFDTDESRARSVAAFLAEGYRADEALIVIAKPRAWTDIQSELTALGVPVSQAIVDKRLIVRDAAETLQSLQYHDGPSAALFDGVVGTLVRNAARNRSVRAYGAMVDLLAQRGEFDFAVRLGQLWCRLCRQVPLNLLCGYCSAHFVSAGTEDALAEICAAHDRIETEDQDQLGAWLLGNAGIQPAVR